MIHVVFFTARYCECVQMYWGSRLFNCVWSFVCALPVWLWTSCCIPVWLSHFHDCVLRLSKTPQFPGESLWAVIRHTHLAIPSPQPSTQETGVLFQEVDSILVVMAVRRMKDLAESKAQGLCVRCFSTGVNKSPLGHPDMFHATNKPLRLFSNSEYVNTCTAPGKQVGARTGFLPRFFFLWILCACEIGASSSSKTYRWNR